MFPHHWRFDSLIRLSRPFFSLNAIVAAKKGSTLTPPCFQYPEGKNLPFFQPSTVDGEKKKKRWHPFSVLGIQSRTENLHADARRTLFWKGILAFRPTHPSCGRGRWRASRFVQSLRKLPNRLLGWVCFLSLCNGPFVRSLSTSFFSPF